MHDVVWRSTAMGAAAMPRRRARHGVTGIVAAWERRTQARLCELVNILDGIDRMALEPYSVWRGVALEGAERRVAALLRAQHAECEKGLSPSARRYSHSLQRLYRAYGHRLHALRHADDTLLAAATRQTEACMCEAVANQTALARGNE